jgi:hypothetical protein
MDLLSSIRKSGSRGGVNFSWDEVSTSQHRENYLGHSLMAPVGRWQKGKDLNWYAKGDDAAGVDGETAEQRKVRERKEEIKKIKEAEEDALARALGLPVAERNQTGANAISVGEMNRVMKEVEEGDHEIEEVGKGKGFGDFVGKVEGMQQSEQDPAQPEKGGLLMENTETDRKVRRREDSRERRHRKHRHRSRSGERERPRHRSRSGQRHRYRRRHDDERRHSRERSRSPGRREHRNRSRSGDRRRARRNDREPRREDRDTRRDADRRPRRSRSPDFRDSRARRD